MSRPLFTPREDPLIIVQEAWWAPGPVWTGAKNLVPTGIRSPYRAARSQSLYPLSYRAHSVKRVFGNLRSAVSEFQCWHHCFVAVLGDVRPPLR
jgi:hypothetical protein